MTIDEAVEYSREGSAILFLGAGFAYGATNIANESFPLGSELCERLIKDGGIDTEDEDKEDLNDLGYVSECYLRTNNKTDLLKFLRKEFNCKSYTDAQKTIAALNWKRIYTTNYDNIVEMISQQEGINRETVTPEKGSSEVLNYKNAIIHLNGYIGSVTEKNLEDTFKLTRTSYRRRTIPDSDWALSLNNDILNAKCFIFIGYSMKYDLELQQIFAFNNELYDKCIFVTYKPTKGQYNRMSSFGSIYEGGLEEFAEKICVAGDVKKFDLVCELKCLKEVQQPEDITSVMISDKDITDLFICGIVKKENIFSPEYRNYLIDRECLGEVMNDIAGEKLAVILHSDLGNGKTIAVNLLERMLLERNKGKVYRLKRITSFISDDMEYIRQLKGTKYIIIEDYNQIIDSNYIKFFSIYAGDDIKYIFTVRSYVNDNLYGSVIDKFKIPENKITMYDMNVLTDKEINNVCTLLNKYSLWGLRSRLTNAEKKKYISKECDKELKNIMLDLFKSKEIKGKIQEILWKLFEDKDLKEITLLLFICEVMALELSLNDIVLLLNKQVRTGSILKNEYFREFFDLCENKIKLKSSIVAYYILQENDYNDEVEKILKKILVVLNDHSGIEIYCNMLRMLVSYSNLNLIFSGRNKNQKIVGIYELGKTLSYHRENPFFWLQYAIAKMDVKDYQTAEIYLDNATAFSEKGHKRGSWQIEIHRARLLLEKTIFENDQAGAFENFSVAHELLYNSGTPEIHYPLRQVSLYEKIYVNFYDGFSSDQKTMFLWYCIKMQEKVEMYLSSKKVSERTDRKKSYQAKSVSNMLESIRKDIVNKE